MAKGEWKGITDLIDAAFAILSEQQPMTIRQLFYRLIGVGPLGNNQASYRKVSRMMTKARRDDRIPWEWIADRTRPIYRPNVWKNPQEYAEAVSRSYRRDYWESQPCYIEIWCEKDTVIGSIQDLADELGITVRVGRGFNSETRAHEIAQILGDSDKPNIVFFLGDHDASGVDIERDLKKRVLTHGSGDFVLRRLAIHKQDIAIFDLPPQRVKQSDPRAVAFLRKHGTECVELDALPPNELRLRIREEVEALLDMAAWNKAINVEKAEKESIVKIVSAMPFSASPD